jgi:hypothetical protein
MFSPSSETGAPRPVRWSSALQAAGPVVGHEGGDEERGQVSALLPEEVHTGGTGAAVARAGRNHGFLCSTIAGVPSDGVASQRRFNCGRALRSRKANTPGCGCVLSTPDGRPPGLGPGRSPAGHPATGSELLSECPSRARQRSAAIGGEEMRSRGTSAQLNVHYLVRPPMSYWPPSGESSHTPVLDQVSCAHR